MNTKVTHIYAPAPQLLLSRDQGWFYSPDHITLYLILHPQILVQTPGLPRWNRADPAGKKTKIYVDLVIFSYETGSKSVALDQQSHGDNDSMEYF